MVALCGAFSSASAQEGKAYYAGKTVRMIVGSGTGGGYDTFSRMIAPYLAKELGTTVIVENQPGAGGLIALNRLYVAPPTACRFRSPTAAGRCSHSSPAIRPRVMTLPGSPTLRPSARRPRSGWSRADSPIREVSQALAAKMKWRWASSGATSNLGIGAAFTCEALRMDCHVVQGYKGSADGGLAVARGEMDALFVAESSANNFVKSKQNWALATMSRHKSRFFPDRPTVYEAAKMDADQTWVMDFLGSVEALGRILIAPPGMPPERLAFLNEAVKRTLHNPQLIADGEKAERIIEYLGPEESLKNANAAVGNVTPEQKARVLGIIARAK